jgi:intracellular sulfur oxidation DsrE/DsrF family protein
MRKFLSILALALLSLGAGMTAQAAGSGYAKQKVVYHINYNDEKQLKGALGNIKNHIAAVGKDNIVVKVVLHGNGVDLLKIANGNLDMQQKIVNLKSEGVAFDVCNNTLVGRKINYKNDLFDVSQKDIVPSGVAEIAKLEQEGYVYIKP